MIHTFRMSAFYFPALMVLSAVGLADTPIKVQALEHSFQLSRALAKAGPVTFKVINHSRKLVHEMVIIKTTLAEDRLPVKEDRVDEGKLKVMGEAEEMRPGKSRKITLNLSAGHYVLICNVHGHYASGMHASFTVTPNKVETQKGTVRVGMQ